MAKFNLAIALCVGLFATNASAGGAAPFYLGGTVGQNNIGDGDTTGHIYGGFQLSDSIAVEVGYTDLGATGEYYYDGHNQEASGYTVAGVMRHRLGKSSPMHVYGKAGVFNWTTETESNKSNPGTVETSGTSALAGVGLEYELNHNMSIKAGWDRYFDVGESSQISDTGGLNTNNVGHGIYTQETDVDVYSAGVNFSFY